MFFYFFYFILFIYFFNKWIIHTIFFQKNSPLFQKINSPIFLNYFEISRGCRGFQTIFWRAFSKKKFEKFSKIFFYPMNQKIFFFSNIFLFWFWAFLVFENFQNFSKCHSGASIWVWRTPKKNFGANRVRKSQFFFTTYKYSLRYLESIPHGLGCVFDISYMWKKSFGPIEGLPGNFFSRTLKRV
jgi:hypothetical protein